MQLSNAYQAVSMAERARNPAVQPAEDTSWRELELRNPREAAAAAGTETINAYLPHPSNVARVPPIPGVVVAPAPGVLQDGFESEEEPPLRQPSQEYRTGQRELSQEEDEESTKDDTSHQVSLMLEREPSECESLYTDSGNCKKTLLVMCLGLTSPDERALGDPTSPPYSTAVQKSLFGYSSDLVKQEVRRRAEADGRTVKCNYWSKKKCIEHLVRVPITNPADKTFLIATERALYEALIAEASEREQVRRDNANWTTNEPYLRLYMCFCRDEARAALLAKDDSLDRPALDARNNDARPLNFYDTVAELFNDPDLTLTTEALPDLHTAFKDPISLRFADMPGGAITGEEVKRRFADARAKLIQVIDRSINSCTLDVSISCC